MSPIRLPPVPSAGAAGPKAAEAETRELAERLTHDARKPHRWLFHHRPRVALHLRQSRGRADVHASTGGAARDSTSGRNSPRRAAPFPTSNTSGRCGTTSRCNSRRSTRRWASGSMRGRSPRRRVWRCIFATSPRSGRRVRRCARARSVSGCSPMPPTTPSGTGTLSPTAVWWNEGFEKLFGYRREDVDPTVKSWTDHPSGRSDPGDGRHPSRHRTRGRELDRRVSLPVSGRQLRLRAGPRARHPRRRRARPCG